MIEEYIELNRTFNQISDNKMLQSDEILRLMQGKGETTWEQLLEENNYIVLLGEAGSGKTTEIYNRAKILREKGNNAFFSTIENLCAIQEIYDSLNPKEGLKFKEWVQSDKVGIFFLDSWDEAKLHNRSFDTALRILFNHIPDNKKFKLIISCRVSDWRIKFDTNTFTDAIRNRVEEVDKTLTKNCVNIFSLAPLKKFQIENLAQFNKMNHVQEFISEIEEKDYWHLCDRPLDIKWLSSYWNKENKLGTYTEIIEFNINEKTNEENEKQIGRLSKIKVREGVENIAAGLVLCKKEYIALNEIEANKNFLSDSICPGEILKDWENNEITELLRRGIFDEAPYGRIKFHHRSIKEYLAASWLKRLNSTGTSNDKINEILFSKIYNRQILRPSLREISAWLSLWIPDLKDHIIKHFPEILLVYGDPSNLETGEKKEILINFYIKFGEMKWTNYQFEDRALKAFAQPEIEPIVLKLIQGNSKSYHLKIIIIRICAEGRFQSTNAIIAKIVEDNTENYIVRSWAIEAIKKIGNIEFIVRVKEFILKNITTVDYHLPEELIDIYFPQYLTMDELIIICQNAEGGWNESWSGIPHKMVQIAERCPVDKIEPLLRTLLTIFKSKVNIYDKNERYIRRIYNDLSESISCLVIITLQNKSHLDSDLFAELLEILEFCEDGGANRLQAEKIKILIDNYPEVKQKLFWRKVERNKKSHDIKYLGQLFFYHDFWGINKSDLNWLKENLKNTAELNDRHLLLDAILNILVINGLEKDIVEINTLISDNVELIKYYKEFLTPKSSQISESTKNFEIKKEKKRLEDIEQHKKDLIWLRKNLSKISKGEILNVLYNVSDGYYNNQIGSIDWEKVEVKFGIKITSALKEGLINFWRTFTPKLPHETNYNNRVEYGVGVGLFGIVEEFDKNQSFINLSPDEINIAIKYAARSMNAFPFWFEEIAKLYPENVKLIINECIKNDYKSDSDIHELHEVLWKLSHSNKIIIDLFYNDIINLLKNKKSPSIGVMYQCIRILYSSSFYTSKDILPLLRRKLKNENREDYILLLLDAYLHIDFVNALIYLEKHLIKLDQMKQYDFILHFSKRFSSKGLFYSNFFNYNEVSDVPSLLILIKIVYKYIRREDDQIHEESYTPNSRDDAEHFRGMLLNRLIAIPGKESYDAFIHLSEIPEFKLSHDVFLNLAYEKLEKDGDNEIWNASDIFTFASKNIKEIGSEKELFELTIEKIQEIKDHFERGDFSTKLLYRENLNETEIQNLIAYELKRNSFSRYSVNREEEVIDGKKPDIRVKLKNFTIGIEIKLANLYSYSQLINTIIMQIPNYLKDSTSNYAVFLLVNLATKKWKKLGNKEPFTFEKIVDSLNQKSLESNTKNNFIHVMGIDLFQS
jgi:hypothetical protein